MAVLLADNVPMAILCWMWMVTVNISRDVPVVIFVLDVNGCWQHVTWCASGYTCVGHEWWLTTCHVMCQWLYLCWTWMVADNMSRDVPVVILVLDVNGCWPHVKWCASGYICVGREWSLMADNMSHDVPVVILVLDVNGGWQHVTWCASGYTFVGREWLLVADNMSLDVPVVILVLDVNGCWQQCHVMCQLLYLCWMWMVADNMCIKCEVTNHYTLKD